MKRTYNIITVLSVAALLTVTSCESLLDPLANGHYTDENIDDYPSLLQGFLEEAYVIARESHYITNITSYLDCATDVGVLTNETDACRKFANGALLPSQDPWVTYWSRYYNGIRYVNKFLDDNIGINTRYLVSSQNDLTLRRDLQGDAFALRAWFEYNLLLLYGGKDKDGNLLGFVIVDDLIDQASTDESTFSRNTYDDCVKQILSDCDSALVYLPKANRDWEEGLNLNIEGSQRWGRFDQVSVTALKALTYLLWASDAFNPAGDKGRWQKAAEYAAEAIDYKLEKDFPHAGKTVTSEFSWMDPNSPECYLLWMNSSLSSVYELNFYPNGFRGNGMLGPTQELVDAFPMANGYPIWHEKSGYDPQDPYSGRDPRFYADIFYNGSKVVRTGKTEVMYEFDTSEGGKDCAGTVRSSLTNYYVKKFMYLGYNASDQTVQAQPKLMVAISWRDMCLAFAEAANRVAGPDGTVAGHTAKEVLSYIRNRTTTCGDPGVGVNGDPYLDECSESADKFEDLVRNERFIEFCFEGKRFFDLTRWNIPLEERNKPVHKATVTKNEDGSLSYDFNAVADTRAFSTPFLPIPYTEMVRTSGMVQNVGWENWNINN